MFYLVLIEVKTLDEPWRVTARGFGSLGEGVTGCLGYIWLSVIAPTGIIHESPCHSFNQPGLSPGEMQRGFMSQLQLQAAWPKLGLQHLLPFEQPQVEEVYGL